LSKFGNFLGSREAYNKERVPLEVSKITSNFCSSTSDVRNRQEQPAKYHISYPIHNALFLFIGEGNKLNNASLPKTLPSPRMILAPTHTLDLSALILDDLHPENEIEAIPDEKHDDIMTRYAFEIEKQYHLDETKIQFVGSMGEADGGVWFTSYPYFDSSPLPVIEPLTKWELIRDTIAVVKKHRRHGIPFGVYTSGLVDLSLASKLKDGIGLKRCIVSLGVSNPSSFEEKMFIGKKADDNREDEDPSKQFQSVCSFIALAAESGFPIEVAVFEGKESAAASDLAKSLGAVHVHTFPLAAK